MAYPSFTAGSVMDRAAVYLNDYSKVMYTYVAQLPLLNTALDDLQRIFEQNEVPVTDTVSAVIPVDANTSSIPFQVGNPHLPADLVEPQILWQRVRGTDPWFGPVDKVDFLPRYDEGIEVPQILQWVWQAQEIRFLAANIDLDVKLDYIRNLFTDLTSSTDPIVVINGFGYLAYRTAALAAALIGENETRAAELQTEAENALNQTLGISSKGRQAIVTRRRPFRAGFKMRSWQ